MRNDPKGVACKRNQSSRIALLFEGNCQTCSCKVGGLFAILWIWWIYIEYFVPVLTVDTVGKVQTGIFPAKRETLLEMIVFNFVQPSLCKA
jgi:hypothetical protein